MAPSVEYSTEGATDQSAGAYGWRADEQRQEACLQRGGQTTEAGPGGIEGDLVQGTDVGDAGSRIRSGKQPFDRLKLGEGGGVAGERTYGGREPVLAVRRHERNNTGTRGRLLLQQWLGNLLLHGDHSPIRRRSSS